MKRALTVYYDEYGELGVTLRSKRFMAEPAKVRVAVLEDLLAEVKRQLREIVLDHHPPFHGPPAV